MMQFFILKKPCSVSHGCGLHLNSTRWEASSAMYVKSHSLFLLNTLMEKLLDY